MSEKTFKAGDKVNVNVTFPDDYGAPHLKGKDAVFETTVHAVKSPKAAEIDDELAKLGRKRHVVLAVPQFNGLGTLLAETDIVASVPDYTAAALTAAGGLRAEDLPLQTQSFELHMAWRGAQDNDPAERWLRSRIQMFCGDPDSL